MVLVADSALDDVPSPDVIVVPGGPGTMAALEDAAAAEWLRRAHETSSRATSVCTDRVVVEGKVTAAGISAGVDMALRLAATEAGEEEARALQLVIEYDPNPPFDSGSLEKADAETQRRATEHMVPATEEPR